MRCRIRRNRYIAGVCFAVIGCYFNRVSSCFQTDRAGNLLTIHFNNNIGQTVRRYNERNRIDSLCDKMNIFIFCKVLSTAGKQVNFCSFRVYSFCIVQVIAIGNHRHTCIGNCRGIVLIRILCVNLCFFYGKSTVTAHGGFTVSGYFGAAFDQNIAFCPYCTVRSRGTVYLAAVNRQITRSIQTGIIACCFNFRCSKLNIAAVPFLIFPDICSVTSVLSRFKRNIGAVYNLQPMGIDSGIQAGGIHCCPVNFDHSSGYAQSAFSVYCDICFIGNLDVSPCANSVVVFPDNVDHQCSIAGNLDRIAVIEVYSHSSAGIGSGNTICPGQPYLQRTGDSRFNTVVRQGVVVKGSIVQRQGVSGRVITYCSTEKIILILRRDLYAVYPDVVDCGFRCQCCGRQESSYHYNAE